MRLRNRHVLMSAALFLVFTACSEHREVVTNRFPLSIGETTVDLVVHRSSGAGLSYVNLHDNENTAVEATLEVLRERGGALYELVHSGERNLTFHLGDSSFAVDPNRIFTETGIDSTLARHSSPSPRARDAVGSFADALLHRLDFGASALVVAVHNNSDDNYSVLSYADGGELSSEARFVHVEDDDDRDDFYFVTSEVLYDELRATDSNVVMQDNERAKDDGSLAILSAREGIPYVNVEAQHGHLEEQREMIAELHDIIVEAGGK